MNGVAEALLKEQFELSDIFSKHILQTIICSKHATQTIDGYLMVSYGEYFRLLGSRLYLKREVSKQILRALLDVDALYISELNLKKENGNNANIVEIIKAYAEGGVSYGYLDTAEDGKGYEPTINQADKKVIVYSSTDIGTDDELANRFITISVDGSSSQTKKVLEKIYNNAAEISTTSKEKDSWIRIGLSKLKQYDIVVPYAGIFTKYTDSNDTRARRDSKRFLNIIKTITFLYQMQRLKFA